MRQAVNWGLALGTAVALQSVVFGAAGWHKVPSMAFVFLGIAVALDILAVVLCLRQTAAETTWRGQFVNGLIVGAVGSILIFASSWLVSAVIFPNYFSEMAEGYLETLSQAGLTPQEVDETVARIAATSPVRSALEAVVGTLATSGVVAAVAAIWLRRRK